MLENCTAYQIMYILVIMENNAQAKKKSFLILTHKMFVFLRCICINACLFVYICGIANLKYLLVYSKYVCIYFARNDS